MHICFVYAIVSIVKANMEVAGHFGYASLHVLVLHGGKCHQFQTFLFPIVVSVVLFLLKRLLIESVYPIPQIHIELLQAEIFSLFKIMEESLFEDTHSRFNAAFVLGFSDLGRHYGGPVVISPFSIVLVKDRI